MKNKFPCIMKTTTIVTAMLTLALTGAYFVLQKSWMLDAAISTGTTAYHFVMRLAVGYIVPKLTHYNFDYHCRWFQPKNWESVFYRKLKLRNWKGKLPTYAPGQFSMAENSMYRIIQNMCGAELVHEIIMVLSFLPLLTVPLFGAFPVFLTTSLLAALFDSVFVMAQRYNRPRLVRIYEKQEAKVHE